MQPCGINNQSANRPAKTSSGEKKENKSKAKKGPPKKILDKLKCTRHVLCEDDDEEDPIDFLS